MFCCNSLCKMGCVVILFIRVRFVQISHPANLMDFTVLFLVMQKKSVVYLTGISDK